MILMPLDFTYSNVGPLSTADKGYMPTINSASWANSNNYYMVEKPLNLIDGSTIASFTANLGFSTGKFNIRY